MRLSTFLVVFLPFIWSVLGSVSYTTKSSRTVDRQGHSFEVTTVVYALDSIYNASSVGSKGPGFTARGTSDSPRKAEADYLAELVKEEFGQNGNVVILLPTEDASSTQDTAHTTTPPEDSSLADASPVHPDTNASESTMKLDNWTILSLVIGGFWLVSYIFKILFYLLRFLFRYKEASSDDIQSQQMLLQRVSYLETRETAWQRELAELRETMTTEFRQTRLPDASTLQVIQSEQSGLKTRLSQLASHMDGLHSNFKTDFEAFEARLAGRIDSKTIQKDANSDLSAQVYKIKQDLETQHTRMLRETVEAIENRFGNREKEASNDHPLGDKICVLGKSVDLISDSLETIKTRMKMFANTQSELHKDVDILSEKVTVIEQQAQTKCQVCTEWARAINDKVETLYSAFEDKEPAKAMGKITDCLNSLSECYNQCSPCSCNHELATDFTKQIANAVSSFEEKSKKITMGVRNLARRINAIEQRPEAVSNGQPAFDFDAANLIDRLNGLSNQLSSAQQQLKELSHTQEKHDKTLDDLVTSAQKVQLPTKQALSTQEPENISSTIVITGAAEAAQAEALKDQAFDSWEEEMNAMSTSRDSPRPVVMASKPATSVPSSTALPASRPAGPLSKLRPDSTVFTPGKNPRTSNGNSQFPRGPFNSLMQSKHAVKPTDIANILNKPQYEEAKTQAQAPKATYSSLAESKWADKTLVTRDIQSPSQNQDQPFPEPKPQLRRPSVIMAEYNDVLDNMPNEHSAWEERNRRKDMLLREYNQAKELEARQGKDGTSSMLVVEDAKKQLPEEETSPTNTDDSPSVANEQTQAEPKPFKGMMASKYADPSFKPTLGKTYKELVKEQSLTYGQEHLFKAATKLPSESPPDPSSNAAQETSKNQHQPEMTLAPPPSIQPEPSQEDIAASIPLPDTPMSPLSEVRQQLGPLGQSETLGRDIELNHELPSCQAASSSPTAASKALSTTQALTETQMHSGMESMWAVPETSAQGVGDMPEVGEFETEIQSLDMTEVNELLAIIWGEPETSTQGVGEMPAIGEFETELPPLDMTGMDDLQSSMWPVPETGTQGVGYMPEVGEFEAESLPLSMAEMNDLWASMWPVPETGTQGVGYMPEVGEFEAESLPLSMAEMNDLWASMWPVPETSTQGAGEMPEIGEFGTELPPLDMTEMDDLQSSMWPVPETSTQGVGDMPEVSKPETETQPSETTEMRDLQASRWAIPLHSAQDPANVFQFTQPGIVTQPPAEPETNSLMSSRWASNFESTPIPSWPQSTENPYFPNREHPRNRERGRGRGRNSNRLAGNIRRPKNK